MGLLACVCSITELWNTLHENSCLPSTIKLDEDYACRNGTTQNNNIQFLMKKVMQYWFLFNSVTFFKKNKSEGREARRILYIVPTAVLSSQIILLFKFMKQIKLNPNFFQS